MQSKVLIPTALKTYTQNHNSVELQGDTIGDVLSNLTETFPEIKKHLFSEDGNIRNFVNVYVNDDDIRYLEKNKTKLKQGDVISIVPSVAGGNLDVELSRAEKERYSRHLIMHEFGIAGQKKLKQAKVLLVGMGGLGAPSSMYLAAAGVGHLGIVDFDVVDDTNLQRQIIYTTADVGKRKLDAAEARLKGINPYIKITKHDEVLSSENALRIFENYDIIVDGTDNFPTRYLVNDACVLLGKTNAYGSIFRFEGQVSVFGAKDGPCYRCLYPEPPPPGLVPSCAEGGVLGILPGVVGVMQATETVKLITGLGEPLVGRLMLYDALNMKFRELKLKKDPNCPVCGESPTVTELIDYQQFCGIPAVQEEPVVEEDADEITVGQLNSRILGQEQPFVLDVREPHEINICSLENTTLIPLGQLPARAGELEAYKNAEVVIMCRSGVRSLKAMHFLRDLGFSKAKNLKGGILAWADEIDPSMPKY